MDDDVDLLGAMLEKPITVQVSIQQAKQLEKAIAKSRIPGLQDCLHPDPAIAEILNQVYYQIEERAHALIKLAEFLENRSDLLEESHERG